AAVGAGVESGTALTVLAPHRAEVLARARVDEHTVDRLDAPLRRATGGAHDPLLLGVRLARREDVACPGPRVDLLVLVGLHGTGAGRGARPVAVQLAGWGRVPHHREHEADGCADPLLTEELDRSAVLRHDGAH